MWVLLKQLQNKLLTYHQTKTHRYATGCTKAAAAAAAEVDSMGSSDCPDEMHHVVTSKAILMKIIYLLILMKLMKLTNWFQPMEIY